MLAAKETTDSNEHRHKSTTRMIKKIKPLAGLTVLVFLMIPTFLFGQADSAAYPIFDITIEPGVLFPQSEEFQDVYKTKSNFNLSIGVKFGTSEWKFLPWIKYSEYQSKLDSLISKDVDGDDRITARRKQLSIGIIDPIKLGNDRYLQLKYGLSYNFMSEESTELYSESGGLILSVGYMKRVSKYVTYYADLNYDYTKTNKGYYFKDWSGFLINFGISLNLAVDEASR